MEIEINSQLTTAEILRKLPEFTRNQVRFIEQSEEGPEEGVCALRGIQWLTGGKWGKDHDEWCKSFYFCPICGTNLLNRNMPSLIVHANDGHKLSFKEIATLLDDIRTHGVFNGRGIQLPDFAIQLYKKTYKQTSRDAFGYPIKADRKPLFEATKKVQNVDKSSARTVEGANV